MTRETQVIKTVVNRISKDAMRDCVDEVSLVNCAASTTAASSAGQFDTLAASRMFTVTKNQKFQRNDSALNRKKSLNDA